jgi:hypothetical protein
MKGRPLATTVLSPPFVLARPSHTFDAEKTPEKCVGRFRLASSI